MGRTFENRKQAMAKRGDRNAKAFTRAGRQISKAVKSGGADPDGNPALRRAIQNARAVDMPKDKINAAIAKASGAADTDDFQEILYEGYGPHGIAVLVETTTDNPTRTVANVRHAFVKGNGNMGNSGSVSFLFEQFGVFRILPEGIDRESLELELIDFGLEELAEGEDDKGNDMLVIRVERSSFGTMQTALEEQKIEIQSSGFEWIPKTTTDLEDEQVDEVLKLLVRLEELDDVEQVFCNLNQD